MNNKDNWAFYDNMPQRTLTKRFEKPSGLDGALELDLIQNLWKPASSILEVGAGEGRIIQGLIERKYNGDIYAVERSNNLCKFLFNNFSDFKNVHVLKMNLNEDNLPKANLGLWLWSGILEFSKDQQSDLIRKIRKNVPILVIDAIHIKSKNNATSQNGQYAEIKTDWGIIRAYIPTEEDIKSYAKKADSYLKKVIYYKTKTGRDRLMYIL
ncbi:MAG: hypothetical protein AABW75_04335 [Nanoarchaeota archaeon]